jgi:hypothetical protein
MKMNSQTIARVYAMQRRFGSRHTGLNGDKAPGWGPCRVLGMSPPLPPTECAEQEEHAEYQGGRESPRC